MMFHKAISISILCGAAAMGQTYSLKGRVLEKVGMKPVPGAVVQISGVAAQAVTDSAGRFNLQAATGISGAVGAVMAAPYIQDGSAFVQAVKPGQSASVELFGLAGARLASKDFTLGALGWNRLPLPLDGAGDFSGFARISTAGVTYVKRVLDFSGPGSEWSGDAFPAARGLAKAAAPAAGNVEVTAEKLIKKTVPFSADVSDLGDIVLDYPPRKLDVGAPPIYGAKVLFDGSKGKAAAQAELSAKWKDWPRFTPSDIKFKIAKDPQYPDDTNRVTLQSCCNTSWGYDDIQALSVHGDAQIHVEFNGMGEYDATEKTNAGDPIDETPVKPGYYNSGVYLQSRYEVQIRAFSQDPKVIPGNHDIAALVDDFAPTANVNRPNGIWQAFDITFRSARYDATGKKQENARVSIWWNGVQVHNNRDAKAPATGLAANTHSGEELDPTLYGLKLQSEGRDVRFRNVWIKDLTIPTAETNFGY
jgi:hypothetical protein